MNTSHTAAVDLFSGDELRELAAQCLLWASDESRSLKERRAYQRMHESLLALADNADWLAGKGEPPGQESQPADMRVAPGSWSLH